MSTAFQPTGFDGQLTLELRNNLQHRPLWIAPGLRICQLVVYRLTSHAIALMESVGTTKTKGRNAQHKHFHSRGFMTDNVNHPSHYTAGGVECIDGIRAALGKEGFEAHCQGYIKYAWRYKHKGGVEDLKKAQVYLAWLIKSLSVE